MHEATFRYYLISDDSALLASMDSFSQTFVPKETDSALRLPKVGYEHE